MKHIQNILSILIGIILFGIIFVVVLWAVFILAPPTAYRRAIMAAGTEIYTADV